MRLREDVAFGLAFDKVRRVYNRRVHPEVQELQPKLKEVLYDCAVEIRATKAALYLFDGKSRFELITEYGFRGAVRQLADRNDPVADRCGRGRSPFFINGISAEPRFSEVLYESSTDRLLAAPIYSRGALVGFIDMRDKAAKQTFDNSDLPKAQHIAERFAELFGGTNLFGQRFITVSGSGDTGAVLPGTTQAVDTQSVQIFAAPQPPAAPAAAVPVAALVAPPQSQQASAPAPQALPLAPLPDLPQLPVFFPQLLDDFSGPAITSQGAPPSRLPALLREARAVANRVVVPSPPESLTENELAPIHDILRCILLIPGASAVLFSAFGHMGGVQEVAARLPLTPDALALLQSRLNLWLTKRGKSAGPAIVNMRPPVGVDGPPIAAGQLQKILTAPVTAGTLRGLYLTVAFTGKPDHTAHELMATMLELLQTGIESSMERGALQTLRSRIAEALVEPDFAKYPELRRHSDGVVVRAEALARYLAMPQAEVDQVKLVARLHDVGMRFLDYDYLYRKRALLPEEIAMLREHTVIGAAIVEPLLGGEIARAVLCHHEQWDGHGYPNQLQGDEIPRVSRVVQVCDVYETMIAPDNVYQPAVPHEQALTMIVQHAGSQFDGEVARRFIEMVR